MDSKEKSRKKANKIAIIVFIILLLLCAFLLMFRECRAKKAVEQLSSEYKNPVSTQSGETEELPENPIDFKSLKERNDEVYAWIEVPNTTIDYPIVQSRVDDNFYIDKDIDKKYLFAGMIYSQSCNNRDFFDPVTVLYGHNMNNGTMFAPLHKFQDTQFFNDNEYFYVYTEKYIFTYRIISAFKYDNRHIMNSFDFNDFEQRRAFQQTILNPNSLVKNVREDVKLNDFSKILVLSTCIGNRNSRYLVCGVMVKDEKTR